MSWLYDRWVSVIYIYHVSGLDKPGNLDFDGWHLLVAPKQFWHNSFAHQVVSRWLYPKNDVMHVSSWDYNRFLCGGCVNGLGTRAPKGLFAPCHVRRVFTAASAALKHSVIPDKGFYISSGDGYCFHEVTAVEFSK